MGISIDLKLNMDSETKSICNKESIKSNGQINCGIDGLTAKILSEENDSLNPDDDVEIIQPEVCLIINVKFV